MGKVLLATDSYYYSPTANGICVEAIADQLVAMGKEVHVLCFRHKNDLKEEQINGIKVHRIEMDWVNKLRFLYEKELTGMEQSFVKNIMIFLNRLEAVFFIHWFPMRSPIFCARYKRKMEQLQNKYSFDIIVASYSPFEAAYALTYMDERIPVKKCLYTLDSFTNLKKRFFMSREYQERKGWKWERKIYSKCDIILNLKCHEKHYNKTRYDVFRTKMKIVDIPHMKEYDFEENLEKEKTLTIMYAGAIRDDIMPYALTYFEEMMQNDRLVFKLYTRSTVASYRKMINKDANKNFITNGFVDRKKVLVEERKADFLLSMGNANSDFISSKVIELIATGKSIIHIYSYNKDSALPYYDIYPNCCCLNINDSVDINKKKIIEFINSERKTVPFKELEKMYFLNSPKYTAQIISDLEETF